jgi:hypothetical protein
VHAFASRAFVSRIAQVKLHLSSPSKVLQKPSKTIGQLTDKGYQIDEKARKALAKAQSKARVKKQEAIMPREVLPLHLHPLPSPSSPPPSPLPDLT